jgi:hypothetical protein
LVTNYRQLVANHNQAIFSDTVEQQAITCDEAGLATKIVMRALIFLLLPDRCIDLKDLVINLTQVASSLNNYFSFKIYEKTAWQTLPFAANNNSNSSVNLAPPSRVPIRQAQESSPQIHPNQASISKRKVLQASSDSSQWEEDTWENELAKECFESPINCFDQFIKYEYAELSSTQLEYFKEPLIYVFDRLSDQDFPSISPKLIKLASHLNQQLAKVYAHSKFDSHIWQLKQHIYALRRYYNLSPKLHLSTPLNTSFSRVKSK